jgi:large subunit ribosomal protein L13
MKTYSPKPEHIERRWYVIDAGGKVLGRVASEAAVLLRGKHKPIYAPHMDTGDNVIIVNAAKVELTGAKDVKKFAYRHSGHPGGITATAYGRLLAEKPVYAVEKAVRGMLPKNRLGRAMFKKLHVVAGPEHPHQAQKPIPHPFGVRPFWEGIPVPQPRRASKQGAEPQTETDASGPASRKSPARKRPTSPGTAKKTGTKTSGAKTAAKSTRKSTSKSSATKSGAKRTTTRKSTAKKPSSTKDDEE